jgi:hypothetical protein
MAVVQISKIQVRRGQKNSPSGVPQLSSAEFAWAVDSQELYIGNGSVAEGAPYVGNTKIITEHDNLLELASSYQFAPDYLTGSVPRSLQGKLDEYVSVTDFGAVGDGSTDCVAAFELAFEQLFRNTNENYKKTLIIPNGEYLFLQDLKIPSGTIMRGETRRGVKLNMGVNNIQFVTADGQELIAFNSTNRPTNLHLSNFTILRTIGQTVFSGVANSVIEDVTWSGEYELTDTITDITTESAALFWQNLTEGTKTTDIEFKSCSFEYNSLSVKCIQSDTFSSTVNFNDCKFFVNYLGTYIDGVLTQENKWRYSDCLFEEIYTQAFNATNGRSTIIADSIFKNCGNGNSPTVPLYPIVYFGEKVGNVILNCSNNRQQLNISRVATLASIPAAITEVYNSDYSTFIDRNTVDIVNQAGFSAFTVLPATNTSYTIKYFLTLGSYSRTGKLTISVSNDLTDAAITDEYQYSPSLTTDPGGPAMTNFEFNVDLADNNATAGIETVVLSYKNPNLITGSLSFDLAYGV